MKKIKQADIPVITQITNERIHKNFPLIGYPIKEWMAKEILITLEEYGSKRHNSKTNQR